jgi:hypothetical protein
MIEQRAAERVVTSLLGTIVFDDGISTCLVRDYTTSGARLRISPSMLIPDRFELHLCRTGAEHQVRLCWRSQEEVGVVFERRDPVAPG